MAASDTLAISHDSDTLDLCLNLGDRVEIKTGGLKGARGVVVSFRSDGHALIELSHGVYCEVLRFCLKKVR
jgi:hypothetical protein